MGGMSDTFKSKFLLSAEFSLAVCVFFGSTLFHSLVLCTLSGLFHGQLMSP